MGRFSLTIRVFFSTLVLSCFSSFAIDSLAQDSDLLKNGAMEEEQNEYPASWVFPAMLIEKGYSCGLDTSNPFEGKQSAVVDAAESEGGGSFGMLNQFINPETLRGKRVRFRAAVRTENVENNGRAQLWLRVDRKSENGQPKMGAFDNMGDRPIQSNEWKHYDIVVDIEDDAERLTVGMLVFGTAKAWIDDASLVVVEEDVETTQMPIRSGVSEKAPTQPFYSHWLWLAGLVMTLMVISQVRHPAFNIHAGRLALTFSIAYWLLYSSPEPFIPILVGIVGMLGRTGIPVETLLESLDKFKLGYKAYTEQSVQWAAENWFGIEEKLILPNGSGDTTFAYIRLFLVFVLALALAVAWTSGLGIFDRSRSKRKDGFSPRSEHLWLRDLLRSYLRYVLALTMLSYGLAKAGFISTQFAQGGVPYESQLTRTYGSSSPMGLLWTFMAVSPMYTFFAGMGEVVGGVLLVFRRTATLGAIVVFGVMLNVVMLNFCYDVPVKQYSFHLLFMAVFLMLSDVPRLLNVLLFNRPTEKRETFDPPYTNTKTVWLYRSFKAIIVLCLFAIPIYEHTKRELQHEHQPKEEAGHLLIDRGYRWVNEYPHNR